MNEHIQQFTPIAGGCFRDTSTRYKTVGGQWCFLEFTPILNPALPPDPETGADRLSVDAYGYESTYDIRDWQGANALAIASLLAGGGWRLPSVVEEVSLRDYDSWAPACKVPGSPPGGFVITRTRGAVSPYNQGAQVLFVSGHFPNSDGSTKGLARGVRFVSVADGSPVTGDYAPELVSIGAGCFRNASATYQNQSGQWCFLECTPVFGPLEAQEEDETFSRDDAFAVVASSPISGGGWRASSIKEEVSLRTYLPPSGIPGDPDVFLITRSSPRINGNTWGIGLSDGAAGLTPKNQDRYFVRGSRLTPST